MKKHVLELSETGIPPNYFNTGNPNPTFEEDPRKQQRLHFTLMVGLACLGLGDIPGATSALRQVLTVDPSNIVAHEELMRIPRHN